MKIFKLLIVGTIFFASSLSYAGSILRDSVMLYYRPNSSVLMVDYKTNKTELANILTFASKNSNNLQVNKAHINVVSYIKASQVGNVEAINNASIQASVVRAQFKAKYNIPHSAITFYIDTTQNFNNQVRVDFISAPIPAYSNNAIYYSESSSTSAMQAQMDKYKPSVPYTNYWMKLAKLNPEMFGFNVSKTNGEVIPAIALTASKPIVNDNIEVIEDDIEITDTIKDETAGATVAGVALGTLLANGDDYGITILNTGEGETKTIVETKYLTKPSKDIFGLKTNLLYWLAAMPNLEMEFYMGKRLSLNIEGAYTWGFFLPIDKAYFAWNAGGEFRFWFNNDGKFNGHFVGVHGGAGQYDFKFSQYGYQGDFYYAGIAYGYMLPIKNNFFMEFSLGAGWANYSELRYETVGDVNFTVDYQKNKNYFGVTKARVSCVWKF